MSRPRVISDNLLVDVTSAGDDALRSAMDLLFDGHSKATHYLDTHAMEDPARPRTLIFLWHEEAGSIPLPHSVAAEGATRIASEWLSQLEDKERAGWIDMDGDCVPDGFRAFVEDWGHVYDFRYTVAAVTGHYRWVGK